MSALPLLRLGSDGDIPIVALTIDLPAVIPLLSSGPRRRPHDPKRSLDLKTIRSIYFQ